MSSSSFALSGVIEPIQSTEVVSSGFLISSAYASINCSNNIYVRLHKISPDGSLISDPVASTRVQGKSYGFESGELPNDIEAQGVGYQLVVTGCEEILYRPVTDVNDRQDITYASTMVGV